MKRLTLSNLFLSDLFQQLALLLHAGVQLSDGMTYVAEAEGDASLKERLLFIAGELEGGSSLSEAFSAANCFSRHVTGLVKVGERVGRTEETLLALSRYYEEQERMEQHTRRALTYPAILLMVMLVVIVVLLTQVLPIFNNIYASLGGSLTSVAGGLLALGNCINAAIPALSLILAVIVVLLVAYACIPAVRYCVTGWWRRRFGDRGLGRKTNNARFAQALSMAISSGLPVEEGISLAADMLSDCPMAAARCNRCLSHLEAGQNLADALNETGLLSPASCRMLALGLRAGTGDATMENISRNMSEECHDALNRRVARIEPALVLVTSALVGAILLSVMLPLMNIMKAIG